MSDPREDEWLARAASGGERAAFAALLERHYDRVYRTVFCVLRDTAEAEDVTQDIWAALPGKLRGWRGEARFTTWLHAIALNAARDAHRRSASRARVAAGFAELDGLSRGAAADTEARLYWLRMALETLAPELRETAALVLGQEMTQAQAADALGVAEGTIAWRMSEIRKALRALAALGREALA